MKIAVLLPIPKSESPKGIQAMGATGARTRTMGMSASRAGLHIETETPMLVASTRPTTNPRATRKKVKNMESHNVMACGPRPMVAPLVKRYGIKWLGGGKRAGWTHPWAIESSQRRMRTAQAPTAQDAIATHFRALWNLPPEARPTEISADGVMGVATRTASPLGSVPIRIAFIQLSRIPFQECSGRTFALRSPSANTRGRTCQPHPSPRPSAPSLTGAPGAADDATLR